MIQPDGKFVVVAGRLLRYDQDGAPDDSFSDDGYALMRPNAGRSRPRSSRMARSW